MTGDFQYSQAPGFSNITKHSGNGIPVLFELFLTNAGPHSWINLLWVIVIILLYTAMQPVVNATQGFYGPSVSSHSMALSDTQSYQYQFTAYTFLDPEKSSLKTRALSVSGIIILEAILFLVTQGIMVLRNRLVARRAKGRNQLDLQEERESLQRNADIYELSLGHTDSYHTRPRPRSLERV